MKRYALLLCLLLPLAAMAQADSTAPAACAKCHVEALTQPTTFMAHALEAVDKSKVLIEHPVLTTTVGKYSYRIERKGTRANIRSRMEPIPSPCPSAGRWEPIFRIGQTYILEKDGQLFESRVSWFRELNGLGPRWATWARPRLTCRMRPVDYWAGRKAALLWVPCDQCRSGKATHPGPSDPGSAVRALSSRDRSPPGGDAVAQS